MRSEYYTRLGRLYEIQWRERRLPQDYQDALAAYVRAEELFPSNPDTALNLGRLYDRAGNYEAALPNYIRAQRLSEEQYHIPRQFNDLELTELNERIQQLQLAHDQPDAAAAERVPPASPAGLAALRRACSRRPMNWPVGPVLYSYTSRAAFARLKCANDGRLSASSYSC